MARQCLPTKKQQQPKEDLPSSKHFPVKQLWSWTENKGLQTMLVE
jgi:hypothetical protein